MKSSENSYREYFNKVKSNWDKIAKPLDSLGKLESLVAKLGATQQTEHPVCKKSCLVVLCADNGIVEEGISQSDQSVTRICAENIAAKITTAGIMASKVNCEVLTYDVGINTSEKLPGVIDRKICKGTKNFLKEPAMTKEQMKQAISLGRQIVSDCKGKGFNIMCVGEMGIGNTTTSAAIAASLLKADGSVAAGRGAGLSDEGLQKKIRVINEAIKKYDLYNQPASVVLQTVGGFDIAVMAGIYLAAKEFNMPIVLDGIISLAAALVAERMEKGTVDYLIPSHKGQEPAVKLLCQELVLSPVIDAAMALGEGTGAVLFLGILDTAIEVYEKSIPFSESKIKQYERFK